MAFGANTSKWYFVGDSTSLERSTKRSEDALERLNRTGKTAFGGLGSAANALTGLLGVGGLAYGIKSLTDAARESELAAARMRTQFDALGLNFETHRAQVERVIEAQSRLAALDDEELSDSFTTILRVTGDVNRSLELNALAADIARARQIDLATAGDLVAKVAGGNIGILSRYGIAIEKGADATRALGELQRIFAGQARAYGESNAGAAERAAVAWENAREELGEKLMPALAALATYISDEVLPAIEELAEAIGKLARPVREVFGFLQKGLELVFYPLGKKTAGDFKRGWKEEFESTPNGGDFGVPKVASMIQTELADAGDEAGEDTAKAFTMSLSSFLRVKFPTMANAALAPGWEDIRKAAEAAGMDVGSAFTAGFQSTAQVTNGQFGGTTLTDYATSQGARGASVANAVNYALGQQGVPYVWGGGRSGGPDSGAGLPVDRGQQGFDCSGLIYAAYKRAGVTVPGTSQAWKNWPHKVASIGDLVPGDVICTNSWKHCVLYIGNNMVIAASGGPSGGGNDKVLIQSLDYHRSGIVGMFRPVPGAQVSAGAIDDVVASTVPGSEPRPSIPGVSSPSSSTPEKRPTTSFPGIAGISDSLRGRFDEVNQPEGEALQYDPKTGKFRSVKVGPELKAMKKLADHIRTKVLPPIQKQINALRKRIRAMSKNKKHDKTLLATLKNKLAALVDERNEIMAFWREVIDTWKELKENAAEDDDTGEEPTAAYDFSGPVGAAPGLPGHSLPTDPADSQDSSLDLQAELDQANARAAVNARSAAYNAAGLASLVIGTGADGAATVTAPGGGTVIVQSLVPPSHEWIARLAGYVSEGAAGQGFQMATAENLGV